MQYWIEKAELLKMSRRPAAHSSDLSDMITQILPYAALWHLLFSTWAFSFYPTQKYSSLKFNLNMK